MNKFNKHSNPIDVLNEAIKRVRYNAEHYRSERGPGNQLVTIADAETTVIGILEKLRDEL